MEMRYSLYIVYSIQLVGLFLFCRGFFPHKRAVLPGYAQTHVEDVPGVFDRLIFVVIDAWRSDFAFANTASMEQLQARINDGSAKAFTAKASTPTVTLPRLKCLTTGAITGFLDAILNIAESDSSSTVASQDSWIGQMNVQGKILHMYGDDTWIRLFPNVFSVSDGTSSFFVSDFTEVDNNVTRHLDRELREPVWDALILHYLGLDHIGHLEGPSSPHMPQKQREMDDILETLYKRSTQADALDGKDTLIIALGDHGMTGDGNHGGASESEVYTAVVAMAKQFKQSNATNSGVIRSDHQYVFHDEVIQSDIVPALSMLMGLPIPQNSLGIVPQSILNAWSTPINRGKALRQNARQLQKLLAAGSFADTEIHTPLPCSKQMSAKTCKLEHISYDSIQNFGDKQVNELYRVMTLMQGLLLSSSNDYRMPDIYSGLTLLALAALANLQQVYATLSTRHHEIVLIMPLLHATSAFASSFIEEEQVIWYYFAAFGLFMLQISSPRQQRTRTLWTLWSGLGSTIGFRLLRRYNQTGQKFSGAPDISSVLQTLPQLDYCMTMVLVITLLVICATFRNTALVVKGLLMSASIMLLRVKLSPAWSIACARAVWALLSTTILFSWRSSRFGSTIDVVAAILFALQSRPRNYPILLLFFGISSGLKQSRNIPWTIATYISLQQASFFALGNSNSLSGLDLSQAYNGVSEYNEGLVGLLLFVSTFIGPVYWQISLVRWLNQQSKSIEARKFARRYMAFASCIYAFALCISCLVLRHHLFVFSVFSPKLLFTAAWTIFYAGALIFM